MPERLSKLDVFTLTSRSRRDDVWWTGDDTMDDNVSITIGLLPILAGNGNRLRVVVLGEEHLSEQRGIRKFYG
jgi:hypothetical protein